MDSIDMDALERLTSESEKTIVVQFGASWSAPSERVKQILKNLELTQNDHTVFVMVDVDGQHVSEKYQIVGIPVVCIFRHGKLIVRYAGIHPRGDYEKHF